MQTVTIDTTAWAQEEVNNLQGTIVEMLYQGGYPYTLGSVHCDGGTCSLEMEGEFPFTAEQIHARMVVDANAEAV